MKSFTFVLVSMLCIFACAQTKEPTQQYPAHVGDIAHNEKLDDVNFDVCNEGQVYQYYNFGRSVQYKGEKRAIDNHFKKERIKGTAEDSGFITIRFIVNCEGKTGRFRVQSMDKDFKETQFSSALANTLLEKVKAMDGWIAAQHEGRTFDYYQYLTFKFDRGHLIEIMP
jgi:hypothetical protein